MRIQLVLVCNCSPISLCDCTPYHRQGGSSGKYLLLLIDDSPIQSKAHISQILNDNTISFLNNMTQFCWHLKEVNDVVRRSGLGATKEVIFYCDSALLEQERFTSNIYRNIFILHTISFYITL